MITVITKYFWFCEIRVTRALQGRIFHLELKTESIIDI